MTGLNSDAQRWRDWIRGVVDSLGRLDGESGLEFCESAGLVLARELQQRQLETQTVFGTHRRGRLRRVPQGRC